MVLQIAQNKVSPNVAVVCFVAKSWDMVKTRAGHGPGFFLRSELFRALSFTGFFGPGFQNSFGLRSELFGLYKVASGFQLLQFNAAYKL
jgi:hypothetical protein